MPLQELVHKTRLLLGDGSPDDPFYPQGEIELWLKEAVIETAYALGIVARGEPLPALEKLHERYHIALPLFAAMRGYQKAGDIATADNYRMQYDQSIARFRNEQMLVGTHYGVVSEHLDGEVIKMPGVPVERMDVIDRPERQLGRVSIEGTPLVQVVDDPDRELGTVAITGTPSVDIVSDQTRNLGRVVVDGPVAIDGLDSLDLVDRPSRELGRVTVSQPLDISNRPERQLGTVRLADPVTVDLPSDPNRRLGSVHLENEFLYVELDNSSSRLLGRVILHDTPTFEMDDNIHRQLGTVHVRPYVYPNIYEPRTSAVTVQTSPTRLESTQSIRQQRCALAIYNMGPSIVYIGRHNVTSEDGWPLFPSDSCVFSMQPNNIDPAEIYAVAEYPSQVRIMEIIPWDYLE